MKNLACRGSRQRTGRRFLSAFVTEQKGFRLPRQIWSLLNRFRTARVSPCCAYLHKCGLGQSPSVDCDKRRSVNHVVDTCLLTKLEGGLNLLHEADDNAVVRLEATATAAVAK